MLPPPLDPDVANDTRYGFDWDEHNRLRAEKKARQKASSFWNDEREAELRRLWSLKITAAVIGKSLGCSRMAVIGKANRLDLEARDPRAFAPPPPKQVRGFNRFWSTERDALLRSYWDDQFTAEQIGQKMGITPVAARKRAAKIGLERRASNWYHLKLAA